MDKALAISINRSCLDVYTADEVKPTCTPVDTLGREIVKKLPSVDGDILVISDVGLLFCVLWRLQSEGRDFSRVTFVAHTAAQESFAQDLSVKTWQVGYNDPITQLEKLFMGLKFDIIVANPPYGNLHLKFLKTCVEHLSDDGVYISVQPIAWLQDPLWKVKKNSGAKKLQETVEGKLDEVDVIQARDGSKMFGTTFNFDLAILKIKSGGGKLPYDALSLTSKGIDLRPFVHLLRENSFAFDVYGDGKHRHFVPVLRSASASSGGFDALKQGTVLHQEKYGYFTDGISNNCKYGNGLTLAQAHKANTRRTVGKTETSMIKAFSTAEEAENFYNFIKLDAFRFFVYITTTVAEVQHKFLPFPSCPDAFKTPWTNQRFYEHFKIAESEQKVIEETMKQFPVE